MCSICAMNENKKYPRYRQYVVFDLLKEKGQQFY